MEKLRVKDISVEAHNLIVSGDKEAAYRMPGVDNRIYNLVWDKFELGGQDKNCPGSTWGVFCAMECMLRYLCYGDVDVAINVQDLLSLHGMGGNRAAENYTFGCDATFERTVPLHEKVEPDYIRVLNGCTAEDSLEKVISQLYQFVLPEKRAAFKNVAQLVYGVSL